jgi:O-antigen ligase
VPLIRARTWTERPSPGARALLASMLGSVAAAVMVVIAGPAAVMLLAIVTVLGLVTAFLPGVLFATYILSGIYKAAWQPYSPVDTTVVLALLNALQVVPLVLHGKSGSVSRIGVVLLVAVGFLYVGGVLYAPDQDIALRYVATFWALALLPMLPAAMRVGSRPEYLRQFLWTLFALGVPMTVLGLMQLSTSQRLEVFGASTIEVSRTALLVPLIWVAFVLRQRGLLVRAVTLLLIPVAVVVAVASGSRGPLLALIILGAVGAIRYLSRPGRVNWRVAGAIAGVTLASFVALSAFGDALPGVSLNRFTLFEDFLGQLFNGDLNTSVGDTSSGRRVVLFGAAVSMFEERPVLGFGTGGFEAVSPAFTGPPDYAWPHNAVLQFAAEFGVVGVALFAGLVLLALTRPFPRDHLGNAVRVAFAFFLLNAMVSDDIYGGRPMWGLLALVVLISLPKAESAIGRRLMAGAPSDMRPLPTAATTGS